MKISSITLVVLSINSLIDRGQSISVAEVFKKIEDHTIFDFLLSHFEGLDESLEGIKLLKNYPEDQKDILQALDRLANGVIPEDLGIENRNHGLLFLNALFNQLIQSNVKEITLH